MTVASGHRTWHPPMIFSAGPPSGGPAEKVKIASVIVNRGARPAAKSCRRSTAKRNALFKRKRARLAAPRRQKNPAKAGTTNAVTNPNVQPGYNIRKWQLESAATRSRRRYRSKHE
ncbi:hypothetical protein K227x_02330 [Rubripirellula lacrimiformis]|uniref:Uncharacterized protein n=1 Tax=Rubripirellula lacrimiformis TaxID=1930273 RepID=A0A517N407_9BACT|nr:hypothetical protein K227x_02330 [Rubripirellula lacrimiformis]